MSRVTGSQIWHSSAHLSLSLGIVLRDLKAVQVISLAGQHQTVREGQHSQIRSSAQGFARHRTPPKNWQTMIVCRFCATATGISKYSKHCISREEWDPLTKKLSARSPYPSRQSSLTIGRAPLVLTQRANDESSERQRCS